MNWIRKAKMMLRYVLYVVFFFLLFRAIRRLFSSTPERHTEPSPLHTNLPPEPDRIAINEADIEDATFEEIEKTPRDAM